jgi:hypothetical protein
MACKIVFYYNLTGAGWSETFYHSTSDPQALAAGIPNSFYQSCAGFRSTSCFLKAIRFSSLTPPRKSFLVKPYPTAQGTAAGPTINDGPDVASTDAVFLLQGDSVTSRRIFIRGLCDDDVKRDIFGNDLMSARLRNGTNTFLAEISARGFCIRKMQRPPDGALTYNNVNRVMAQGANIADFATIWFNDTTFPNAGDVMQFVGVPANLPHFPRQARMISAFTDLAVRKCDIEYRLPGGVTVFPPKMKACATSPIFGTIQGWNFERFSEHKTGRPFGSLRGRARAV